MPKKKCIILIANAILILGIITANVVCASGDKKNCNSKNYEKILKTWVGHHVDELVKSWGIPQGSYPLSDGGHVVEYLKQRSLQMPSFNFRRPKTTYHSGTISGFGSRGYSSGNYGGSSTTWETESRPGLIVSLSCKTIFQVNPEGIIAGWSFEGNDCNPCHPVKGRLITSSAFLFQPQYVVSLEIRKKLHVTGIMVESGFL